MTTLGPAFWPLADQAGVGGTFLLVGITATFMGSMFWTFVDDYCVGSDCENLIYARLHITVC